MKAEQSAREHLLNGLQVRAWTHWGLSPGPSACVADVIPLRHVPLQHKTCCVLSDSVQHLQGPAEMACMARAAMCWQRTFCRQH